MAAFSRRGLSSQGNLRLSAPAQASRPLWSHDISVTGMLLRLVRTKGPKGPGVGAEVHSRDLLTQAWDFCLQKACRFHRFSSSSVCTTEMPSWALNTQGLPAQWAKANVAPAGMKTYLFLFQRAVRTYGFPVGKRGQAPRL